MLFTVRELSNILGISPRTIVHVGAHRGEERESYISEHWDQLNKIIWVEAQPTLAQKLQNVIDPNKEIVINSAVWNTSGKKLSLKITNNSESTSLLDFAEHSTLYPSIAVVSEIEVTTVRLDEILPHDFEFDFLNLDIQGAELAAIQGLGGLISKFNSIYTEVNFVKLYEGCALITEIDQYLADFGFRRVSTRTVSDAAWGDAIYIKNPHIMTRIRSRILSVVSILKKVSQNYRIARSKISLRSIFPR